MKDRTTGRWVEKLDKGKNLERRWPALIRYIRSRGRTEVYP
jgi:hypothetical protein